MVNAKTPFPGGGVVFFGVFFLCRIPRIPVFPKKTPPCSVPYDRKTFQKGVADPRFLVPPGPWFRFFKDGCLSPPGFSLDLFPFPSDCWDCVIGFSPSLWSTPKSLSVLDDLLGVPRGGEKNGGPLPLGVFPPSPRSQIDFGGPAYDLVGLFPPKSPFFSHAGFWSPGCWGLFNLSLDPFPKKGRTKLPPEAPQFCPVPFLLTL